MIPTPRTAVAALLAVFATLAVTAGPAHADPIADLVCDANFQLNFDPPLRTLAAPQAVDVLGQAGLTACTALSGSGTGLLSATVSAAEGSGTAVCPLFTVTGSGEFEWNTGQTSGFDFAVNLNPAVSDPPLGLAAEITSGPLAGDTVTAVPVVVTIQGNCLTGVDSIGALFTGLLFTP
jgi:hypothetical protein